MGNLLYGKLARYYDKLNSQVDYKRESNFILELLEKKNLPRKSLLDVGCGTGNHLVHLKEKFEVIIGIDINEEMLQIARKKLPGIDFLKGDMRKFSLNRLFDSIICMFGVITYNRGLYRSL